MVLLRRLFYYLFSGAIAGLFILICTQAVAADSLLQQTASLTDVGTIKVAADGSKLLFLSRHFVFHDGRYISYVQVWLKTKDQAAKLLLPHETSSQQLALFSPSGKQISYATDRDDVTSLSIINLSQQPFVPHVVFKTTHSIVDYQWAPNGRMLAVRCAIDKPSFNKDVIHRSLSTQWQQLFLFYLPTASAHVNISDKKPSLVALTPLSMNVGGDSFIWDRQSKRLIFDGQTDATDASGYQGKLYSIHVKTHKLRLLLAKAAYYNNPKLLADGKEIAFQSNFPISSDIWAIHSVKSLAARRLFRLCTLNLNHPAAVHCLSPWFDHDAVLLGFAHDQKHLMVNVDYHLTWRLQSVLLHGGQTTWISPEGDMTKGASMNDKGNQVAFASESPLRPIELYSSSLPHFKSHQITHFNASLKRPLMKTEVIHYRGVNGHRIEALLTYPLGFKQHHGADTKKYPLIIASHGGPSNRWWNTYTGIMHTSDTPFSVTSLAAKGFFIFRANPHGSTGYGRGFLLSNYKKLGSIDLQDLTFGVRYLIRKGFVNPHRIGIWGWSYGGFMAFWALEHRSWIRAAVSGAGISDWVSLEGTSYYHTAKYNMGSYYWKNYRPWVRLSPIFFVSKVHGPLLIQSGTDDKVVPWSQAMQMDAAMREANKPVQIIGYKGQGHEFSRLQQLAQATNDMQNFFMVNLHD